MIEHLLAAWPIDPMRSLAVGDSPADLGAAAAAGLRGARFPGGRLDDFLAEAVPALRQPCTKRDTAPLPEGALP